MNDAFKLLDASAFDARKGFSRWVLPGTVAHLPGHPQAVADLWTDGAGRLFARFSCAGHVDHFRIVSAGGAAIAEEQKEVAEAFLQDKLVVWVVEDFEAEAVWE